MGHLAQRWLGFPQDEQVIVQGRFGLLSGVITFTAAGTFQVSVGEGTSGDTFTIQAYSWMDVVPI